MPKYLIIDGYNAINKIASLIAKREISLEASRDHFISILNNFLSTNRLFSKVYIVFDSRSEDIGVRKESCGRVEVLFGNTHKDADKVIVDILKNAKESSSISVASDDNFVRNHARAFGCDPMTIRELESIIMLKKKISSSKIREKEIHHKHASKINEELKKHWRLG
ncbi:MAG: NYN domain-containing protein [Candidatus Omnitrophota bacterium]